MHYVCHISKLCDACGELCIHCLHGSLQVILEYEKGNYAEAQKASRKALAYNIGALLAGIAIWVVSVLFIVGYVILF